MDRKLLAYYKPYKMLLVVYLCLCGLSATALIPPKVISYITNTVVSNEITIATILKYSGILIVAIVGSDLLSNLCFYVGGVMGVKIEIDMKKELYDKFLQLSSTFYDEHKVGELISRMRDIDDVAVFLKRFPRQTIFPIVKVVGSFIILYNMSPLLAVCALIPTIPMAIYTCTSKRRFFQNAKEKREVRGRMTAQIEDCLNGIRVSKSFANETLERKKFAEVLGAYARKRKNSININAEYSVVMNCLICLSKVIPIAVSLIMISKGIMKPGDLVGVILYIDNFIDPILGLTEIFELVQDGISGYQRFREIMNTEIDIQDNPGSVKLDNVDGEIKFQDVSFRYNGTKENILKHFNFTVHPGEFIGIVGSSGCGKSTLSSLIPRFYDVNEGNVLIDGVDTRNIILESLRNQIGIVQQDVYLFSTNVMENIRYGRPDATDEEVIAAAKLANAHNFIMSLPEGYQTDVGPKGVKLSGGQKQRISIARVFLKNPQIVIFDEATSALDNESEKLVQKSMEKLTVGKTVLAIAHRLTTIQNADRIVVMNESGIAEEGTHAQLMGKNGIYAQLYQKEDS